MRSPGLIHTPPIQYIIIIEYENLRVTPHLYRNAESQTAVSLDSLKMSTIVFCQISLIN